MNLTDKISVNFNYGEVIRSIVAKEMRIDNTMPSIYYNNAMNLAKYILEPIRAHFGMPFSPSSWYRCKQLNDFIGGELNSQHLVGQAADISVPKVSLIAVAEYIRDNLVYDQLIMENAKGEEWVHVSFCKNNNRKEVLRMVEGKYLPGLI